MKKVVRLALSQPALDHLADRQAEVDRQEGADAQTLRAGKLWKGKKRPVTGRRTFEEIERVLVEMCNGPRLCMYCERNEATDIEHVKPRSHFPGHAFRWANYLYACPICNSRFKMDLYHLGFLDPSSPDFDLWSRWTFDPATGDYRPLGDTDTGAARTLEILGFDRRVDLARRRRMYLFQIVTGVREYAKARMRNRHEEARDIARGLCLQFPALVEWALVVDPPADLWPDVRTIRRVKDRFPEIVEDALGS